MTTRSLEGRRILLSASIPDELRGTDRAQSLYHALGVLSRRLFAAGARLVFGGHPSITPLIHRSAARITGSRDRVALFQAANFRSQAPPEVFDPRVFPDVRWIGEAEYPRELNLARMREAMAEESHGGIFIGGRRPRPDTPISGVRDELLRFREVHPPAPCYLLGMLGGETAVMIREVEAGELVEPNGLDPEARQLLHHSDDMDLIAPLIVRDLVAWLGRQAGGGKMPDVASET